MAMTDCSVVRACQKGLWKAGCVGSMSLSFHGVQAERQGNHVRALPLRNDKQT